MAIATSGLRSYKCWIYEHEERDSANVYKAFSPRGAAEECIDDAYKHGRLSCVDDDDSFTVTVEDADGKVTRWIVVASISIEFAARLEEASPVPSA